MADDEISTVWEQFFTRATDLAAKMHSGLPSKSQYLEEVLKFEKSMQEAETAEEREQARIRFYGNVKDGYSEKLKRMIWEGKLGEPDAEKIIWRAYCKSLNATFLQMKPLQRVFENTWRNSTVEPFEGFSKEELSDCLQHESLTMRRYMREDEKKRFLDCLKKAYDLAFQEVWRTQGVSFGPSYRSARFRGKELSLTEREAQVMEILHDAYLQRNPDVAGSYILEQVVGRVEYKADKRVRDLFRRYSDVYRKLVAQGRSKGTYRLNLA
jgi:hypothetical protein